VTGSPGAVGRWGLGPIKDARLVEQSPGVYVGAYRLRPGDDMQNAHLMATLVLPDGRVFTDSVERPATLQTGPPAAPIITSPGPNAQITDPLVVRGTAQPNSTVRLKIDYVSRLL